jgi:hypothetical protein
MWPCTLVPGPRVGSVSAYPSRVQRLGSGLNGEDVIRPMG